MPTTAVQKLIDLMAADYDPAAVRFPRGTAVYWGSQAWTVGYELDGLVQITRDDNHRFVSVRDLHEITDEDLHRAAAFAHLGRLS